MNRSSSRAITPQNTQRRGINAVSIALIECSSNFLANAA
jgi:hypothetical protein